MKLKTKRFEVKGEVMFVANLPEVQTKEVAQKRLDLLASLMNANLPQTDVLSLSVKKVEPMAF